MPFPWISRIFFKVADQQIILTASIGQAPNQWPIGSWPLDSQGESSREHHTQQYFKKATQLCDLQKMTSLSILVLLCLHLMSCQRLVSNGLLARYPPKTFMQTAVHHLTCGWELGNYADSKIPVRIAELDMELVDASPQFTWIGPDCE